MKTTFNEDNSTTFVRKKQLKMAIDTEIFIPESADVRVLSEIIDTMDLHAIERNNCSRGRRFVLPENIMLKLLVYGYMDKRYSSRDIATACWRDVNFIWLLDGYKAPSHNTIARFRNSIIGLDNVFAQMVTLLAKRKEVTFDEVYIDGTKLEASANKYSFVWNKAINKFEARLDIKISELIKKALLEQCILADSLDDLIVKLSAKTKDLPLATGKGKRKTLAQKLLKTALEYQARKQKYASYNKLFDGRNSFSKTDTDATFMRMKDDYMRNGQLKPGYNLQIAVNSEYITSCYCSSDRDDVNTLVPFLDKMKEELPEKYQNIVADSGYESEENYMYLDQNKQTSYIKPTNYEISKTAKYIKDKSKRENMQYNADGDYYLCQNNKRLTFKYDSGKKSKSGYVQTISNYECESCESCPHKAGCTKAQGNRTLVYSKQFNSRREQSLINIVSEHGKTLRMNRSIQVEGAFGVLKQDYGFRRFLTRGTKNVKTEFTLLCFGYNIKKLHAKTKTHRNNTHLHALKNSA